MTDSTRTHHADHSSVGFIWALAEKPRGPDGPPQYRNVMLPPVVLRRLDLVQRIEDLQQRKIGFRCLNENIDTTSPGGKFQFRIFSALAEFERDLIRERTRAGLLAARARGRKGGRKRSMTPDRVKTAARLMKDKGVTVGEICKSLGVSRSSL